MRGEWFPGLLRFMSCSMYSDRAGQTRKRDVTIVWATKDDVMGICRW